MLNTKMIGNKIADARKKKNISQAELAKELFISSQAVGKWERGESMPDIITLNRLAEILSVDLNYFSAGFESAAPDTTPQEQPGTRPVEMPPVKPAEKPKWDMSQGNWEDADFSGLKNLNEKFSSSNIQRCKFIGSDLSGFLLKGNHVVNCDFSDSDISSSHIHGSHLSKNMFRNCSLTKTEFLASHIEVSDFSGADFTGAEFKSSTLQKNTMTDAVLNGTSFIATEILDMDINGTIEDCIFENCAFRRVTFRNAAIINTFFKNTDLKRTRFIDCKADRLTYEFLKSGKADLSGITLLTADEGNE